MTEFLLLLCYHLLFDKKLNKYIFFKFKPLCSTSVRAAKYFFSSTLMIYFKFIRNK